MLPRGQRHDPLHRRDGEPARLGRLRRVRRRQARAARAGAEHGARARAAGHPRRARRHRRRDRHRLHRRELSRALRDEGERRHPRPAMHIAENYWQLHRQPRNAWTHEMDLRPVDRRNGDEEMPMSRTIEFYFDFGSPTTYLAWTQLPRSPPKAARRSSGAPCCSAACSRRRATRARDGAGEGPLDERRHRSAGPNATACRSPSTRTSRSTR